MRLVRRRSVPLGSQKGDFGPAGVGTALANTLRMALPEHHASDVAPTSDVWNVDPTSEPSVATRHALVEILSVDAATWGKVDLARWLREAYAPAAVPQAAPPASTPRPIAPRPPDEGAVLAVLLRARLAALDVVALANAGDFDFACEALDAGHVVLVRTARGIVFQAVDLPRMSLLDRIVSLLAADCLTDPDAYERDPSAAGLERVG